MPVPHADLIRAVLDGKVVQMRDANNPEWADYLSSDAICWLVRPEQGMEFRLKPEPSISYHAVIADPSGNMKLSVAGHKPSIFTPGSTVVKVSIDPTTKAVTVEGV